MKRVYLFLLFSIFCFSSAAQEKNGFIDLGLSVKWASCNLGASQPEDFGDCYAWGETTTKSYFAWKTYEFGTYSSGMAVYNEEDKTIELKPEHDAATVVLGEGCRIPTREDFQELKNKCKWQYTSVKGVNGYKVVGPNGNSIFLPIYGYYINDSLAYTKDIVGEYWTSTRSSKESHCAYFFRVTADEYEISVFNRCHGRSVRAVCD